MAFHPQEMPQVWPTAKSYRGVQTHLEGFLEIRRVSSRSFPGCSLAKLSPGSPKAASARFEARAQVDLSVFGQAFVNQCKNHALSLTKYCIYCIPKVIDFFVGTFKNACKAEQNPKGRQPSPWKVRLLIAGCWDQSNAAKPPRRYIQNQLLVSMSLMVRKYFKKKWANLESCQLKITALDIRPQKPICYMHYSAADWYPLWSHWPEHHLMGVSKVIFSFTFSTFRIWGFLFGRCPCASKALRVGSCGTIMPLGSFKTFAAEEKACWLPQSGFTFAKWPPFWGLRLPHQGPDQAPRWCHSPCGQRGPARSNEIQANWQPCQLRSKQLE